MSQQKPIHSGFTAASTASDVIQNINLEGKNAIVTGGYSGLGLETVRTLVKAGAHVIVPTRDLAKAKLNLKGLANVEIEMMDLMNPNSIDGFADKFLASQRPLHILINSAGIMAGPLQRDSRGYESQFSTNHLGHFQLTNKLLPALKKAHGARVVSVSSLGHRFSPVVFDDIQFEKREYNRWAAYGQSKTANILFAVELDRRFRDDNIRAIAVHPGGIVDTGLGKHVTKEELTAAGAIDKDGKPIIDPSKQLKTVEQGAATLVWAATNPKLQDVGGVYCEDCEVAHLVESDDTNLQRSIVDGRTPGLRTYAIDPKSARQLWEVSQKLIE